MGDGIRAEQPEQEAPMEQSNCNEQNAYPTRVSIEY